MAIAILSGISRQLAKAKGSEALTTALGSWTAHLWEAGSQDAGEQTAPCLYIDGHRKPVYADSLIPRGLIGRDFPKSWEGERWCFCMMNTAILAWRRHRVETNI